MKTPQYIVLVCVSVAWVHGASFGADPHLLPASFAGWHLASPAQNSSSPANADPTNAAVLKEYGFTDVTTATYTRDDGRHLTLKAARFDDASGAFGAYTFYRTTDMHEEEIGDQGASLGPRVLFFRGKILVDALFEKLSGMSAAELRELANDLPKSSGTESKLPDLASYLPRRLSVKNSLKYIVGPLALEKVTTPLSPQFVDFAKGAEVVLREYSISNKSGTLMVIGYPNPQIAASELARIEAAQKAQLPEQQPLAVRRSGRIVALADGSIGAEAAHELVSGVNYDADVTWNQNTYRNPKDNPGRMVLGGIILSGVLIGILLVSSIAFGGVRLALNRLMPGKVFDRPEQVEIIGLHLSDPDRGIRKNEVNSSIKAG